jgi:hypothetical protein
MDGLCGGGPVGPGSHNVIQGAEDWDAGVSGRTLGVYKYIFD